jgi:hypothetical protein
MARSGGGIGDLGYEGEPDAVYTPIKKPQNTDLSDLERHLNRRLARITTTCYRADLSRIDTDIQATVGRQKLNEQFADRRLTYDQIKAA